MEDASPEMLSIFAGAIERRSPGELAAFLDAACGADVGLRLRIEALLRAHDEAGGFLRDRSEAGDPVATVDRPASEGAGTVIGPYKLLEQIGEGGFGVVFMAEQTEPVRRKVALKVLKPGMDTRQVVARFEAERQALAIMDHPNIAKVFDGGATTTGRPYFVMELVKGVPITEFCDQNRLTPRQRLELFIPLCQAVQHAHQKGIIHRDLKPSNVLVTVQDTTPVVKAIDFGVAKALGQELTDKTLFTGFAQMIGTPLYMSPEQAGQSGLDIDTRSDIYSLGVLLYELLTGTTPFTKERFQQAGYDEIRRIIREEEPPKPSTRLSGSKNSLPSISALRHTEPAKLTTLVRGELDWIVMKCLEKDRNRRYETASAFAADLERYLKDDPVLACPPSSAYRLRKFARRNKGKLTVVAVVVLALVLAIMVLTRSNAAIDRERVRADDSFREARAAVDDYFTTVSESKLLDVPGLQPLRKELLENALRYYQSFVEKHGDDPTVRGELGKAYFRVGFITVAIGSKAEAMAAFQKAREIQEQLGATNPIDGQRQADRAATYSSLGEVQYSLNEENEALRSFEKARTLWEELVRDHPGNAQFRRGLALSYYKIGEMHWNFGHLDKARGSHDLARQIREKLFEEHPTAIEFMNDLAASLVQLAHIQKRLGANDSAIQLNEKARELRTQLVRSRPGLIQFEFDLADTWASLGICYRFNHQPEKALYAYEQGQLIFEKLLRQNPSVIKFQRALAGCHSGLGNLHIEAGQSAEAVKDLQRACAVLETLKDGTPNEHGIQQMLALRYTEIGELKGGVGEFAEGLRLIRSAQAICEKGAIANPKNATFRYFRGIIYAARADLLWESGSKDEARRFYDQAHAVFEQLVIEFPEESYQYLGNLADFLSTCPVRQSGDARRAVEMATRALERAPQVQGLWNTLGLAQYRNGDWKAAIAALEKSVELCHGGIPNDWFFLAMAHWQEGDKAQAKHLFAQAVQWMEKNGTHDLRLNRYRAEAAELLGIKNQPPARKTSRTPEKA
jgi:serine/threonine protein kinase/Flp pilus assembly protein TadD